MDESGEKKLRVASFAIHASRGLIRDQASRRRAMFILMVVALVLLFAGSTFLQSILNPKEHPGWFIFFWFVCAWITFTAVLLAIFDVLLIRIQRRKAERALRDGLAQDREPGQSAD